MSEQFSEEQTILACVEALFMDGEGSCRCYHISRSGLCKNSCKAVLV